ncbi:FadR/GntR family transcriptional regulator [Martelella sp. HB161492]|uniref:FadR/GntR family transcriptional regulator n=1 Tax=Martelella sp. HB161492 TaxID=2720726 RepID=UPI001AEE1F65
MSDGITGTASPTFAKRGRLADAVIEHLTNAIVTGVYPVGKSLPTETALCDMYQVSRTVIREVSTTLAEKGLIISQQGRGTIVQEQSKWNLLDSTVLAALFRREDGLTYLDSLIEIRLLLECAMSAKAAERITDDEITALRGILARLKSLASDPLAYGKADLDFHDFIMEVSGNQLGRAIINGIQGQALATRDYHGHPTATDIKATHLAHEAIVDAIARHDAKGASQAMHDHIEGSWKHRRRIAD